MFVKIEIEGDSYNIIIAPNYVLNVNYSLYKEDHETYNYPVDGWYWVDDESEIQDLEPIKSILTEKLSRISKSVLDSLLYDESSKNVSETPLSD